MEIACIIFGTAMDYLRAAFLESNRIDANSTCFAQSWRRRPPAISVPVGTLSPGRIAAAAIAIPAAETSPGQRISFDSGISLSGSLDSLDLASEAQSPPGVQWTQEEDAIDV